MNIGAVKIQIYLSTICFNQILIINVPIVNYCLQNKFERRRAKIAHKIKTHETSFVE